MLSDLFNLKIAKINKRKSQNSECIKYKMKQLPVIGMFFTA
jgi:hypothetical protein